MTASTHPVAPEEVMALLDGELSHEQAQVVSAHIEHCDECTTLAKEFRSTSHTLAGWTVQPAPETIVNRMADSQGRVRRGLNIYNESFFIRVGFWSWKRWMVGLSATAAVLLITAIISISGRVAMKESVDRAHVQPRGFDQTLERPSAGVAVFGKLPAAAEDKLPRQAVGHGSGAGRGPAQQEAEPLSGPMIARTVSVSIVVKDFVAARANLDAILNRHHGYAANLTANTAENAQRSIEASLRVPAPELDAALADLKALGKVEREAQNGEEVTQQHADLVARLKNSREEEKRLQAILTERTGKVKDVLEVEQEIARVRGEIEQMDAEQRALEHRVEFATVNLTLTEEYKAQLLPPAISAGTRLHNALVEGYKNAAETVLDIVLFFAEYTLTLLIWGLILVVPAFLLWRRFRRALATV